MVACICRLLLLIQLSHSNSSNNFYFLSSGCPNFLVSKFCSQRQHPLLLSPFFIHDKWDPPISDTSFFFLFLFFFYVLLLSFPLFHRVHIATLPLHPHLRPRRRIAGCCSCRPRGPMEGARGQACAGCPDWICSGGLELPQIVTGRRCSSMDGERAW